MKNVKEYTYDKNNSWQGYMDFVKSELKRVLKSSEYFDMMKAYINGVKPEDFIKTMENVK